jgi:hypothetical protein
VARTRLLYSALLLAWLSPALVSAQSHPQPGVSASITADEGCVIVRTRGLGAASIKLTEFGSATVQFEVTPIDSSTVDNCSTTGWTALSVAPAAGGSAVTSATADGLWTGSVGPYAMVRARASAFSSGPIVVTINLGQGGGTSSTSGGGGGGDASLAEQQTQTTHLAAIELAVETLDNAISGNEMQVDVLTMPTVTVTATNLDIQSGGADLATAAAQSTGNTSLATLAGAVSGTEVQVDVLTMPTTTVTATNLDVQSAGADLVTPTVTADASVPIDQTAMRSASLTYVLNAAGDAWVPATSAEATHSETVLATGPQTMLGALAHSANPTAVTAGEAVRWAANRAGVPFVIGGHPNILSPEFTFLASDGAQTNQALVTVSAGTKIVITEALADCDAANSGATAVRLGFAAATLPSAATTGAAGIVLSHPGIVAGSGVGRGTGAGIVATGGDGEDLRLTMEAATGGSCVVNISYFTIES